MISQSGCTLCCEDGVFLCNLKSKQKRLFDKVPSLSRRVEFDYEGFAKRVQHDAFTQKVFNFMESIAPKKIDGSHGHYRDVVDMGDAPLEERVSEYITKCIGAPDIKVRIDSGKFVIVEMDTEYSVFTIEIACLDRALDAAVYLVFQLYYHLTGAYQDVKVAQ